MIGAETEMEYERARIPAAVVTAVVLGALVVACGGGLSDERAVDLVEAYNQRLIEAYRTADPVLVESVAGPEEAKKIFALVGVKSDQGITLDSALLEFEALGVERPTASEIVVTTAETWYYLDRRIGQGEAVGEDSTDHYRMTYHLRQFDGAWKVAEVRFAAPPQVGRTEVLDHAPAKVMHGVVEEPGENAEPSGTDEAAPEPPGPDSTRGDQP